MEVVALIMPLAVVSAETELIRFDLSILLTHNMILPVR